MQASGVWSLQPLADMSAAEFRDWQALLEDRTGVVVNEQRRAFLQTSLGARMRELGIRIALGATRNEILRAALGRAFKLLAIGSAAGVVLGLFAGQVLAFIVYMATPHDAHVLIGAVFAMVLLGLLATWIPAHRALSIDPLKLLRDE